MGVEVGQEWRVQAGGEARREEGAGQRGGEATPGREEGGSRQTRGGHGGPLYDGGVTDPDWRGSKGARALTATGPWLLVLAVCVWTSWPLLGDGERYYTLFRGDQIKTQWFYDYVARALFGEASLSELGDFNHPYPHARGKQYPTIADALLAAPAALLVAWPLQWGLAQAMTVFANGFGAAALAGALGARHLGVVVAGALGAMTLPAWRELFQGRLNSAWPGLVLGGLAITLVLTRAPPEGARFGGLLRRLPGIVPVAILGALCGLIYPPYLLALFPLGLVAMLSQLRLRAWAGWLTVVLGCVGAVALAWPDLQLMLATPTYTDVLEAGSCPEGRDVLPLGRWLTVGHWPPQMAPDMPRVSAVAVATWALAPLALLWPRRRLTTLAGLASMGLLAALAMGPCPSIDGVEPLGDENFRGWMAWADSKLSQIHDRSRFAVPAALVGAVLSGLGLEALTRLGRRWLRAVLSGVAVILGGLVVVHAAVLVLGEMADMGRWSAPPATPTADVIVTLEAGPLIELPFSHPQRYMSAVRAPGSPRLNPLDDYDPGVNREPVARWLYALGVGREAPAPTAEEVPLTRVRWVLYDPSRCGKKKTLAGVECVAALPRALREVFGEADQVVGGVLVWDLSQREVDE